MRGPLRRALAPAIVGLLLLAAGPAMAANPRALRFGLNDIQDVHSDPALALTLHQRLGSTVQRIGLPWRSVEPVPGRLDWTYPDRLYHAATRRGMRPIMVLGQTPGWAATRTFVRVCLFDADAPACERPPADAQLPAFRRFVFEAAYRYPRAAAIEVFNEPNLGTYFWMPAADPEGYTRVLKAAHDAVQEARPALPVLLGGITNPPAPLEPGMMAPDEFLSRVYAAGGKGAMDGIAVHPYPSAASPGSNGPGKRLTAAVRAIRDANGDSRLPLWLTEIGYTTKGDIGVSLAKQAEWLPALVEDALRERDVAAVVVNTLADRDTDQPDGGYGVTFADLTPKPVFDALAARVRRVRDERTTAACRCSARARRCARKRSRSRSCRKARKLCTCRRRWRRCVLRGSNSRSCRSAKRCARCTEATATGVRCPRP
jgi:hypothetical protein